MPPPPTLPAKKSESPDIFHNVWILYYRHGMNATLSKGFYFNGTMVDAIRRARKHCEIMNYHYIWVRPMVCDFDSEEYLKLNGKEIGEQVAGLASTREV